MFKTSERTIHMCVLVIYKILKCQHWKKLFHLQSNRLNADESWNSIWYKKEKKTIVSKLIMNMLAQIKDNHGLNRTEKSPTHLGIMSQLERMILCQDIFGYVWKKSRTQVHDPRKKHHHSLAIQQITGKWIRKEIEVSFCVYCYNPCPSY